MDKVVFAEGGLQFEYPMNSIAAYMAAVNKNFGVIIDVVALKDNNIICYKNRYMKMNLDYPGKIAKKKYSFIKTLKIKGTKYRVPLLKNVIKKLKFANIIIKINGSFSKSNLLELMKICEKKHSNIIFHSYNIKTYMLFKLISDKEIIFGKELYNRFEILKGKTYNKLNFIPEFDDIVAIAGDKSENIVKKIYTTFNKNSTRVDLNHFIITNNIAHRAISASNVKEHSVEGMLGCIKKGYTAEIDVVLYNGKIKCYHNDNISRKLGQEASIAQKIRIEDSMLFEEALKLIDGKIPIIIDIKDFSIFNRKFQKMLMEILANYKGEFVVQCWNPLVVRWFFKNYPEIIRGQVGNSLSSLNKTRNLALLIVNFLLFYKGNPDYIVYDLDKYVMLLSKFNNILGIPVIGYTAYTKEDIQKYKSSGFSNIIIEGEL